MAVGYDEVEHGTVWALELEQYPGLVVRVRKPGFAAALMLARAEPVLADRQAGAVRRMNALAATFTALADSMDSWTLTRNGSPVPTTRAGVLACDGHLLAAIVAAWRVHVLNPVADRQKPSEDADGSFDDRVLRGLPMEALNDPAAEQVDDGQAEADVNTDAVEDVPELASA